MLEKLTHFDFAEHLNSNFTVALGGKKTQKWLLVEADTVRGSGGGTAKRQAFAVLFSGPGKSPVPQGVYTVKHPKMKNMKILVAPVSPEGGKTMHYEAVFA